MAMSPTVFERYGGFATFSKIVSSFYDAVLESPVTRPHFASVDMRRLIDHQTKFIASATGGPASYSCEHIRRVHASLGIDQAAFAAALAMFRKTLQDFGMSDADVQQVCREILAREHLIVTR
jgi:hemoglobin